MGRYLISNGPVLPETLSCRKLLQVVSLLVTNLREYEKARPTEKARLNENKPYS